LTLIIIFQIIDHPLRHIYRRRPVELFAIADPEENTWANMSSKLQVHPEKGALCDFHVTPGPKITESQLTAAASLFSCCYGVWSAVAPQMVDVNIKPSTFLGAHLSETVLI
jgi:hypothetical protein